MRVGDKVPIVFEIVRPLDDTEAMIGDDGEIIEVSNLMRNKFWAKPTRSMSGPLLIVCNDGETEAGLKQRRAIVDLIECGVGG